MHNIAMILILGLLILPAYGQGELEKLPPTVNTDAYDESSAVISRNGTRLFFTRTASPDFDPTIMDESGRLQTDKEDDLYQKRLSNIYSEIAGKTIADPVSSVYNQDIWIASVIEDTITEDFHPGYPLNSALTNSLVSTGMTEDEYIIINQFYEDGSMYAGFSRTLIYENGDHSFPQPMHIYEFNVNSSDVNLTMSPSGHVLILSMNRSDSRGANDLFVSYYVRENVWSAPINMGDVLNTEFQETTPHITPDKRFLYFSSNRPGGSGGNDIYVSERLDYTWLNWSQPVLLKGEVNSEFDDSQPYFDPLNHYMYFTSRRDGSSDIFRIRLIPKPVLKKPIYVRGTIVDASTGQPTRCEVFWGQQSAKNFMEYFNSYNGHFDAVLSEFETYKFQPRKPGHIAQQILVDPRVIEKHGDDTVDIVLYISPKEIEYIASQNPAKLNSDTGNVETITIDRRTRAAIEDSIQIAQKLFLYNIQFVKAKPIILTKSMQALHDMVDLMKSRPALEVRIEGHTDNVGDELALIDLSEQRAAAVRDYLVDHGIETERIQNVGLGATRPIRENITESGREKNRRVEIKIIKN